MSTYTPEGIGALIYKNGKWGPGGDKATVVAFLDTAIAVALAESGGNDQATHKNSNGSTDYGLWQINSVHKDLLNKYTWNNASQNTEMARQVWTAAGKSFSPWATYTSGAYKKHTGHGEAVYAKLANMKDSNGLADLLNPSTYVEGIGGTVKQAGSDVAGAAKAVVSPFSVVKGALDAVFKFLKQGVVTIGVFILAVVLLIIGFRTLLQNSPAYRKAEAHAMDAAKLAAVV